MKKQKVIFGFILSLMFCAIITLGCEKKLDLSLTAEIRGDGNQPFEFGKNQKKKLHFILKTVNKDVTVFEEDNSWGWFNRFFTAQDKSNPNLKFVIYRGPRSWLSNAPSTQNIKAGDTLDAEVDFCDGYWKIHPKLVDGKDHRLILQGYYEVHKSKEKLYPGDKPWIGQIETNNVEIVIKKECIGTLNHRGG